MPPGPPASTDIYRVYYSDGLNTHTLSLRAAPSMGNVEAIGRIADIITEVAALCYTGTTFSALFKQEFGTNSSFPVDGWFSIAGVVSGSMLEPNAPRTLGFYGREQIAPGRKTGFYVFGTAQGVESDWKLEPDDVDGQVGAVISMLNAQSAAGMAVSPAGNPVTWYPRATSNYNDYYVRRARR